MSKIYVIIGTGRSGTAYTSKLLRHCGLSIGHEVFEADGISSWYLNDEAFNKQSAHWQDLSEITPVIAHQLRNPLKTIPSLMTINNASWEFIKNSSITSNWDKSLLLRSMRHWLDWNLAAYDKAEFHWTLEGLQDEIKPFLKEALPNLKTTIFEEHVQAVSYATNSSKTRLNGLQRIVSTSPCVLIRRLRHAYFPLHLTAEKMHAVDYILANEIVQFYEKFKVHVGFKPYKGNG